MNSGVSQTGDNLADWQTDRQTMVVSTGGSGNKVGQLNGVTKQRKERQFKQMDKTIIGRVGVLASTPDSFLV
jgi:hypothetical protein